MATDELRRAFRFHLEHGGYATPPGRAMCALERARDDLRIRDLVEQGIASIEWVWDESGIDHDDIDTIAAIERGDAEGPYGCIVTVGQVVRSLSGIVLATGVRGGDPYARVIEAELAGDALNGGEV